MDISLPFETETQYLIGLGLLILVLAALLYVSWRNRYFAKKKK